MTILTTHINTWVVLGFTGQLLFGSRFFVQWIISEKRGESIIPEIFWYLSMGGSAMLLMYAIYRHDPVFILGQSTGLIIYIRNIMLIYKRRKILKTAAGGQREEYPASP